MRALPPAAAVICHCPMPAAAPNISHVTLPVRLAVCCRPKIACTTCTSSARAQVLHGSCTDLAQVLHGFCTGFARGAQGSGRPVQYRGGAKSAYSPLTHIKSGAHRRTYTPPQGSAVPPVYSSTAILLYSCTATFSAVSGRRPLYKEEPSTVRKRPVRQNGQKARVAASLRCRMPLCPPLFTRRVS